MTLEQRLNLFAIAVGQDIKGLSNSITSINSSGYGGDSLHYYINAMSSSGNNPGSGKINFDTSSVTTTQTIGISIIDADGASVSTWLANLSASTNTTKGSLRIFSKNSPNVYADYRITNSTNATTFYNVSVAYVVGNGVINASTNNDVVLSFSRAGDIGVTPNISIGSVITGNPGTTASISNTGTTANPLFNFTIPRGATGATGGSAAAVGTKGDLQFNGTPLGNFDSTTLLNWSTTKNSLTVGVVGTNLSNNPMSVNGDNNGYVQSNVQNVNSGSLASSDIVATSDNGNDTKNYIDMGINSSTYNDSSYTITGASDGYVYVSSGALALGTDSAKPIRFHTGGTLISNQRMLIDANGNVIVGSGSNLLTTATNGFFYVSDVGGTPIATPTSIAGSTPLVVDSVNNKLYFYSGASWVNASVPVYKVTSISSAYTIQAIDDIIIYTGTTNVNITLPTAVGSTKEYVIKNRGSSAITLRTTSSQTIDASTTRNIVSSTGLARVISNGSNWVVIGNM